MDGVAGVVLAGGRSTRMGSPKAELVWHGSTVLRRVIGIVARAVDGPVLVVAAPGQRFAALPMEVEVEVVHDPVEGRGPLQGLAVGFGPAATVPSAAAIVLPTAPPPLHPTVARRLAPAGGIPAPAQAAALWSLEQGERLVARRRAAAAGERRRLAAALAGTPVSFADGHGHLVWLASAEDDGAALAARLAAQKVYVAPGSAWGDERHVRAALRDAAATDRLAAALTGP